MRLGVQFSGAVGANSTFTWFTHSWPATWRVIWMIVPTGPTQDSAPQIEWKVRVERQTSTLLKYYLAVTNLSGRTVNVEARYAVLD